MNARLSILFLVVSAAACIRDLPARSSPTINSAEVGPSQPAVEELGAGEAEARATLTDRDVRRDLDAERSRWARLERMHESEAGGLLALWKHYEKAHIMLTVLEARLAATPEPAWSTLAAKLARAESARRFVDVWLRRGLASSAEWDETHTELETAVVAFERAVEPVP